MFKRFHDTDKWKRPWYRKLSPAYKCFFDYITSECDNVGVWIPDFETAEYFIGGELDIDLFLKSVNENIKIMDNGKWWIVDFCRFQYVQLDERSTSNCIKSYINLLKSHGLWELYLENIQPLNKPTCRLQDKDKEKDKDKDKDKDKEESNVEADRLALLLYTLHLKIDSGYQVGDPQFHSWACDIDKINRLDGRDWQTIEQVLRWAKGDSFWATNIMSGKKFRDKFDQLLAKMPKQVYTEYKPSLPIVESTPEFDANMERNVP